MFPRPVRVPESRTYIDVPSTSSTAPIQIIKGNASRTRAIIRGARQQLVQKQREAEQVERDAEMRDEENEEEEEQEFDINSIKIPSEEGTSNFTLRKRKTNCTNKTMILQHLLTYKIQNCN